MGLVEKIGRKLSPRSNDTPTLSKPDGSSTANGAVVRHIPPHLVQTRHGYVHMDAAKGQPGIVQTAAAGCRSDTLSAPRNVKATDHQGQPRRKDSAQHQTSPGKSRTNSENQAQPRRNDVAQHQTSPGKSRTNTIVPPTSRLTDCKIDSCRASPESTELQKNGPLRSEAAQSAPAGIPRGQPKALHKQPSVASSLHSSRSGKPLNGSGSTQQGTFGNQRSRANTMPANSQRPPGMSTRRMEDSAYHAGFRDAVAQLERERQRRGPALSH